MSILDEILIRVYMYSRRDLCGSPDLRAAVGLDKLRFL